MDNKQLLRIHGYVHSSDSDSSCDSDLEHLHELLKPPPLLIDSTKTEIVRIKGTTPKNNVVTIKPPPSNIATKTNLLQIRTPISSLKANKGTKLQQSIKVCKKNKNKRRVDQKIPKVKLLTKPPPIKPNKRYQLYSLLKFTYSLLTLKHDRYDCCKCYIQNYFKRPDNIYSYKKSSCLCRSAVLKEPLRKKKGNKKPHKISVSRRSHRKKRRKNKNVFASKKVAYENNFWYAKTPVLKNFRSHKQKEIEDKSLPEIYEEITRKFKRKMKKQKRIKENVRDVHEISSQKLVDKEETLNEARHKIKSKTNKICSKQLKETCKEIYESDSSSEDYYIYDFNLHDYNKIGSKLNLITAEEKQQYELSMKTEANTKKTNPIFEDLLFKDLKEKFVRFFHHLENDEYILYKSSLRSFLESHKINDIVHIMLKSSNWSCKDILSYDDVKRLFFLPLLKNRTKGKISLDIYKRKCKFRSKSNLKVMKIVRPPPVKRKKAKKKKLKVQTENFKKQISSVNEIKSSVETPIIPCNLKENVGSVFLPSQLSNQSKEQTLEIYVRNESISNNNIFSKDDLTSFSHSFEELNVGQGACNDGIEKVSKIIDVEKKEETEGVSNDFISTEKKLAPVSNTPKKSINNLIAYESESILSILYYLSVLEEIAALPSNMKQDEEDTQEILLSLSEESNLNQILTEWAKQCTSKKINYLSINCNLFPSVEDPVEKDQNTHRNPTKTEVLEETIISFNMNNHKDKEMLKSNWKPILPEWLDIDFAGKKKKKPKINQCEVINEETKNDNNANDEIIINDQEIKSSTSTNTEKEKQVNENSCFEITPLKKKVEDLQMLKINENVTVIVNTEKQTKKKRPKKKKNTNQESSEETTPDYSIDKKLLSSVNAINCVINNDESKSEVYKETYQNPTKIEEYNDIVTFDDQNNEKMQEIFVQTSNKSEKPNLNPILTEWLKQCTPEELNYFSNTYNLPSVFCEIQDNPTKIEKCDEKNNNAQIDTDLNGVTRKNKKTKSKKKTQCEVINEETINDNNANDEIIVNDQEIKSSTLTNTEKEEQVNENSCFENTPLKKKVEDSQMLKINENVSVIVNTEKQTKKKRSKKKKNTNQESSEGTTPDYSIDEKLLSSVNAISCDLNVHESKSEVHKETYQNPTKIEENNDIITLDDLNKEKMQEIFVQTSNKSEKPNLNPILTEWLKQCTPEELNYFSKTYNLPSVFCEIQDNPTKIEECDEKNHNAQIDTDLNGITKKNKKKKSKKKTQCEVINEENINDNNANDKIIIDNQEIKSSTSTNTEKEEQVNENSCFENTPLKKKVEDSQMLNTVIVNTEKQTTKKRKKKNTNENSDKNLLSSIINVTSCDINDGEAKSEVHKETSWKTNCDTGDDNKHSIWTVNDTVNQLVDADSFYLSGRKDIASPSLNEFEKLVSSHLFLKQPLINEILLNPVEINNVTDDNTGLSKTKKKKKKKSKKKTMEETKETVKDVDVNNCCVPLTDLIDIYSPHQTCLCASCVSSPKRLPFTAITTKTEDLFLPVPSTNSAEKNSASNEVVVDLPLLPKKKKKSKKKDNEKTVDVINSDVKNDENCVSLVGRANVIGSNRFPIASTSKDNYALLHNKINEVEVKLELEEEEPKIIEINSDSKTEENEIEKTQEAPQSTSKNKYSFDIPRNDDNMDLKHMPLELFALHLKNKNSLKNIKKLMETNIKPEVKPPNPLSYSSALKTVKTPELNNKNLLKKTAETSTKSSNGAKTTQKVASNISKSALKKTVADKANKNSSNGTKSSVVTKTKQKTVNNTSKTAPKKTVPDKANKKPPNCAKSNAQTKSVCSSSKSRVQANVNININVHVQTQKVIGEPSDVVKTKKKRKKKKANSNPLLDAILRSIK